MRTIIYGAGGFAKEVYWLIKNINSLIQTNPEVVFCVDDQYFTGQPNTIRRSELNTHEDDMIIAIANPTYRKRIVDGLSENRHYLTVIHPLSEIGNNVKLGEGSVVCYGANIMFDAVIGKHAIINIHSLIGHDCVVGDYLTCAPNVGVGGNCKIGNNVFIGMNASIRQGVTICNGSVIGMGAVVVKDITEPGTYVGNPLKKIK